MARIPLVTATQDARSGRSTGGIGGRLASASAFGGDIAGGLSDLASGIDQVGAGLDAQNKKRQRETVANKVAQADFTRRELELRNEVGPDAAGYQERTLEEYEAFVDEQAEGIEDDTARQEFKRTMMANRNSVSSRAAQYEVGTRAEYSKDQANQSITTLQNQIRTSPDQYDTLVAQGDAVLDTRDDLPASARSAMKQAWRSQAAGARFEAQLGSAATVDDVDAIAADLTTGDKWKGEMSAASYEATMARIGAVRNAINTKADADARAAVETLEARAQDVTSFIDPAELSAVQQVVNKSTNPVTAARLGRIVRDQQIIETTRRATPAQQRQAIMTGKQPSLPPRVNSAVMATSSTTGISQSYLAATVSREYGQYLAGDPDQIDYGRGNAAGDSSATGIGQIIDGTADRVFRSAAFQAASGIDTSRMSQQQIRDLRKNPEAAMFAVATLAKESDSVVRAVTGRPATDAELYMGHFLGAGGLHTLMRGMQENPNQDAVAKFPKAAASNPTVYKNKDGSSKTLQELYNELGRTFPVTDTYIEYGDNQTRTKVLEDTERRLADDPMAFAYSVQTATQSNVFQPGGMAARGEEARSVASYYSIPADQMKPFTKDEAQSITAQLQSSSADEALQIVMSVQALGGDMAKAGMSQIGEDGNVYAYAGGMAMETGQATVASDVVRGQKRIEENPAIADQIGATREELGTAFTQATGAALYDAAPAQRQAIQDAALAHYIETQVARGKAGSFDGRAYEASIQAVMGGAEGSPAVDTVNGEPVALPRGVTGDQVETALQRMTLSDWTSLSVTGQPPRYQDGTVADPQDLADEAVLRAIGGGQYRVGMADGTYLTTGRPGTNGRVEAYIMSLDANAVRKITDRQMFGPDVPSGGVPAQPGSDVTDALPTGGTFGEGNMQAQQDIDRALSDGILSDAEFNALRTKYGAAIESMIE